MQSTLSRLTAQKQCFVMLTMMELLDGDIRVHDKSCPKEVHDELYVCWPG